MRVLFTKEDSFRIEAAGVAREIETMPSPADVVPVLEQLGVKRPGPAAQPHP